MIVVLHQLLNKLIVRLIPRLHQGARAAIIAKLPVVLVHLPHVHGFLEILQHFLFVKQRRKSMLSKNINGLLSYFSEFYTLFLINLNFLCELYTFGDPHVLVELPNFFIFVLNQLFHVIDLLLHPQEIVWSFFQEILSKVVLGRGVQLQAHFFLLWVQEPLVRFITGTLLCPSDSVLGWGPCLSQTLFQITQASHTNCLTHDIRRFQELVNKLVFVFEMILLNRKFSFHLGVFSRHPV